MTTTMTQANRTTLAYGVEPSAGTEPSSTPATFYLGPNSGTVSHGPEPERIAHDPLGPSPMAEAGATIRTMAPVGFELNLIRDHFLAFLPGAFRCALSTTPRIYYPTSVTSTAYVVGANGALAAGTLIIARGFATAGNNGFKVVGAASDATNIKTSGLTAEASTDAIGATVEVCGFQFAAGDAEIDASGNLITTTKDLTELGLEAGQTVFIGGDTTATKFATAAHRGHARVSIAPAAHLLTLDNKQSGKFPSGSADSDSDDSKTVQIFYGRTLRTRSTTHGSYLEPTYQLEIGHGTLSSGSAAYEYVTGCSVKSYRLSLPTATKGAITLALDGANPNGGSTVDPTASRRTSFSSPLRQNALALMQTADHIRRGRLRQSTTDLTGIITGVDINIDTGANRNEGHGQQDNVATTYGDIVINVTAQAFFSTMELIPALKSDTVCNADWMFRCGGTASDGNTWGFALDMPAVQIDKAPRSYDAAKPSMVSIQFHAVRDTTYSTLMIVSDFPYLPAP